jgi:hypothetical protein
MSRRVRSVSGSGGGGASQRPASAGISGHGWWVWKKPASMKTGRSGSAVRIASMVAATDSPVSRFTLSS